MTAMIVLVLKQQRDALSALGPDFNEVVQRLDGAIMRLEAIK